MTRCTYGKSGGVGAENCGIKWGMKGGRELFKVAARETEDGRSLGWGGAAANLKFRLLSPPPPPPPSRTFQPRFKGEYSTTAHKRPAAATWEMVGRRGREKKKTTPSVFLWGKIYSREVLLKRCGTFKPMPQNFCPPPSFCFQEERLRAVKENTLFSNRQTGPTRFKSSIFRADGDLASCLLTVGSFMEISCHARRRGTVRAVAWPPPNFEYFVGNGTSSI